MHTVTEKARELLRAKGDNFNGSALEESQPVFFNYIYSISHNLAKTLETELGRPIDCRIFLDRMVIAYLMCEAEGPIPKIQDESCQRICISWNDKDFRAFQQNRFSVCQSYLEQFIRGGSRNDPQDLQRYVQQAMLMVYLMIEDQIDQVPA